MLDLESAIKHEEKMAEEKENNAKNYPRPNKSVKGSGRKYNAYLKCAEEHKQLAEWLKDYKRLREQTMWIPVSERLPEDGRPVLIYAWNVHHVIARYDSFRTENGYRPTWVTADAWNGNTEIKHDVIAWMPLPESYKAGPTCADCILDKTDACTRGAGRAVDDEACEDYLASPAGAESEDGDEDSD